MEGARMELMRYDEEDLATLPLEMARGLAEHLGVQDNGFEGPQDLRERFILMKRKMQKSGHKPWFQFLRVQAEAAAKRRNLLEVLRTMTDIFKETLRDGAGSLIDALSSVLIQERLLSKHNLLDELADRKRALQAKETLIIIAGETNSGKSTYLNVLLGQPILPTDVLHCTYVVCKIVYSHCYIVETLDYQNHYEEYHCEDCDEARAKLKEVVTCDNLQRRQQNSSFKEITLKMPAEILKSGITFVDTPGIGENAAMDGVTINFVREAQASAFIYIIKSDGAGGVQEDRLLAFLRAVQENYKNDRLEGTFDPQAAMFVCHRWDTINASEVEKVKKNALIKLEAVWPGFRPNQTFLFSSKKTKLHFDIDPDFITDSFNDLLNGLKHLIDRATHNAIKYQYCWIKTFLQPACLHLRSMISHCTINKEELDEHFRDVAEKQERLLKESADQTRLYERKFDDHKAFMGSKVKEILSLKGVDFLTDLDGYGELLSTCKADKFFQSSENCQRLNHQIVMCLVKYCDDYLLQMDILKPIEDSLLQDIKEHLGLLEDQTKQIKRDIQGKGIKRLGASLASCTSKFSLNSSDGSSHLFSSETDEANLEEATIPDPDILNQIVNDFLHKKKSSGKLSQIIKITPRIIKKLRSNVDPKTNLDNQIVKLAAEIRTDESVIDDFVSRYLDFSDRCIKHAINCIPNFIAVNTELMNKIREHREAFLKDKQLMKEVMEKLEPYRAQLQGYGVLYMEDVQAEQIHFIIERKNSSVQLQPGLMVSTRPNDDSGFVDGGSTRSKTREKNRYPSQFSNGLLLASMKHGLPLKCFWTHLQNARMNVDDTPMDITIKTYSLILEDSEQYSEIAALRCLEHVNVASFFGMTRIESANAGEDESKSVLRMPAFIFKGQLWAANIYRKMKLVNLQEFIPTFLIELWQGLDFIHMEHLVHLELNLDTVMVDSQNGTVKLCQQCKPREAQLPADLSCKTKSAVCLSPSALQGNIYQLSDDIYAFGLLLWELLYPKNLPFKEQRDWTLKKFIEEVHPSKMLKPALENLNTSPAVKTILDGCLICTKGTIITMKDISRGLSRFRQDLTRDPAIIAVRNPRTKPLEMRSVSSQTSKSVELMAQSMDGVKIDRTGTDITTENWKSELNYDCLSQKSSNSFTGEKLNGLDARTDVTAKVGSQGILRRGRQSVIAFPDTSELEVPANVKKLRKASLPNSLLMSLNEKGEWSERHSPILFDSSTKRKMDGQNMLLKGKETSSKKAMSKKGKGCHNDGVIPFVKIDPPCEQEADLPQNVNFENDLPVKRNSVPHESTANTSAMHCFDRPRQTNLRRSDAVRVLPFSQKGRNINYKGEQRRNTDGDIMPLLEEQMRHCMPSRSQTFTFSDSDANDQVDSLHQGKGSSERNYDTVQAWGRGDRKNYNFTSVLSSSSDVKDAEKVRQQEKISKQHNTLFHMTNPSWILDNDSLHQQPNKETKSQGSEKACDSAYQSSKPSSILTNKDESFKSTEFSDSSITVNRPVSPFCPVMNSACVNQCNLNSADTDTGLANIEIDDLPPLDFDNLCF